MRLSIFNVPFDGRAGRFSDQDLQAFLADKQVVSAHPSFYRHDGWPACSIVIVYEPASSRAAEPSRAARKSGRPFTPELDADGQGLYRALLLWRSAQAREAGVPPYVVLTNAQAAALAAERPTNLAGIRNINGMGEKRVAAHGQAILEVIGHGSPEAP